MQVGKHGNGPWEFDQPRAIRIDKVTGHIFIVDTNNSRVQVWDENFNHLTQFGKGILHYPRAIAITDKAIFITDFFRDFLYKFNVPDFSVMKTKPAKPLLKLHNPTAIDDDNNEIFVLEADKQRIIVFTESIEHVRTIAQGAINVSYDMQVHSGLIHVLEVDTNVIKLLNSQNGELIASVLTNHNSMPFSNACHFSVSTDLSHYFIVDWKANKIKVISSKGAFVRIIDTSQFECLQPRGIVSLPNNDIILSFQEGKNVLVKIPAIHPIIN